MMNHYWPAEWNEHSGCILLVPHNPGTYRIDRVIPEFIQVVKAIAKSEQVFLFCNNEESVTNISNLISEQHIDNNVKVFICPSNDTWARDTCPTFVIDTKKNSNLIGLDWDFNAYGGKDDGCYWPCNLDQQIATNVCNELKYDTKKINIILEGGSIHTDGEGTIITTKECILNKNRNPNMSQEDIEQIILETTGCTKIIWLQYGLANDDDTNGHVDNFCCFIKPTQLVLAWTDDKENDNDNYNRCRNALNILQSTTDCKGRKLTIHKLYLPKPIIYTKDIIDSLQFGQYNDDGTMTNVYERQPGERMAASYINFYISNNAIIVPQFGDYIYDERAINTLQQLFDDHEVIGVHSLEILIGGGNIHCITQQIPKKKYIQINNI